MTSVTLSLSKFTLERDEAYKLFKELCDFFSPELLNEKAENILMKSRLNKAIEVCRLAREFHDKMYMSRSEEKKRSELTTIAKLVDEVLPR